jgi:hypothetical protein
MIVGGQLPDSSIVTADSDAMAGGLTYSVEAKPLPEGAAAGACGARVEHVHVHVHGDEHDDDSSSDGGCVGVLGRWAKLCA